jgi:hypothetical protein
MFSARSRPGLSDASRVPLRPSSAQTAPTVCPLALAHAFTPFSWIASPWPFLTRRSLDILKFLTDKQVTTHPSSLRLLVS